MSLIRYISTLSDINVSIVKSMVLKIIVKKVKKNVHKLDLNIKSTYLCRNKNEKAMKKQEMINAIMLEERKLWDDLQECLEKLGANDPITESATTRWATINKLVKSLGL